MSGHSGAGSALSKMAKRGEIQGDLVLYDAINGTGQLGSFKTWVKARLDADLAALSAQADETKQLEYLRDAQKLRGYCTKDYSPDLQAARGLDRGVVRGQQGEARQARAVPASQLHAPVRRRDPRGADARLGGGDRTREGHRHAARRDPAAARCPPRPPPAPRRCPRWPTSARRPRPPRRRRAELGARRPQRVVQPGQQHAQALEVALAHQRAPVALDVADDLARRPAAPAARARSGTRAWRARRRGSGRRST